MLTALTTRSGEIYPRGLGDLLHTDRRVLGLIVAIATRYGGVYVSSLKTGHSHYVAGSCTHGACKESRHWTYRAADLWKVGGHLVKYGNDVAEDCWVWLKHLDAARGRPATVGSPWGRDDAGAGDSSGHFTDSMHKDHFHLDYRRHPRAHWSVRWPPCTSLTVS